MHLNKINFTIIYLLKSLKRYFVIYGLVNFTS